MGRAGAHAGPALGDVVNTSPRESAGLSGVLAELHELKPEFPFSHCFATGEGESKEERVKLPLPHQLRILRGEAAEFLIDPFEMFAHRVFGLGDGA